MKTLSSLKHCSVCFDIKQIYLTQLMFEVYIDILQNILVYMKNAWRLYHASDDSIDVQFSQPQDLNIVLRQWE